MWAAEWHQSVHLRHLRVHVRHLGGARLRRDMSGDHELHRRRGYVRLRVREAPVSSYRRFPPEQVRVHLREARQCQWPHAGSPIRRSRRSPRRCSRFDGHTGRRPPGSRATRSRRGSPPRHSGPGRRRHLVAAATAWASRRMPSSISAGVRAQNSRRMLLAEAYEREGVPPFPACARWPTSRRQRPALRSHDESCVARLNAEKRRVGAGYVNEASLAEAVVPAKARIEPLDGENAARPTAARLGKRLLERAGDDDGVVRLEPETLRPELKGDGWPTVAVRADGDEIWPSIWIEVAHEHTAICAGEERQEWRGEGGRREGHANESAAERRVQ